MAFTCGGEKLMLYRIKDILYQDNGKGTYMTSKIGEKYDRRRGHVFDFDENDLVVGRPCVIVFEDFGGILTTPFVGLEEIDENVLHLKTENSIYVLEKTEKDSLD